MDWDIILWSGLVDRGLLDIQDVYFFWKLLSTLPTWLGPSFANSLAIPQQNGQEPHENARRELNVVCRDILMYPSGNDHISHQTGKRKIIDSKGLTGRKICEFPWGAHFWFTKEVSYQMLEKHQKLDGWIFMCSSCISSPTFSWIFAVGVGRPLNVSCGRWWTWTQAWYGEPNGSAKTLRVDGQKIPNDHLGGIKPCTLL